MLASRQPAELLFRESRTLVCHTLRAVEGESVRVHSLSQTREATEANGRGEALFGPDSRIEIPIQEVLEQVSSDTEKHDDERRPDNEGGIALEGRPQTGGR